MTDYSSSIDVHPAPATDAIDRCEAGFVRARDLANRVVLFAAPSAHADVAVVLHATRACGHTLQLRTPGNGHELTTALREVGPGVLVLHTELLRTIDRTDLLSLRHRFPATDWVLAANTRTARWVDPILQFQPRGCFDCGDPLVIGRAIEAVVDGKVWFPKSLSEPLWLALVGAMSAAPPRQAEPGYLTPRETQAIGLLQHGLTNKEIARHLDISVNTVKKHLKAVFEKRGLRSRRQLLN